MLCLQLFQKPDATFLCGALIWIVQVITKEYYPTSDDAAYAVTPSLQYRFKSGLEELAG